MHCWGILRNHTNPKKLLSSVIASLTEPASISVIHFTTDDWNQKLEEYDQEKFPFLNTKFITGFK